MRLAGTKLCCQEATTTLVEKCNLCLTWISKFYNIFIFGSFLLVILGGFEFKLYDPFIGVIVLVSVHFMMNCAFCAFGVEVSGGGGGVGGGGGCGGGVVVTDEIYWFLMYTMQVLRSFRMYYKSLVGCKINIINTCRFIQYSTPRENSITLSLYIISWHVYNFY
jgi:hypothetical protein